MQKITPFLWYENQAEEAMNFYTSIFRDSKPGKIRRYGKSGPDPEGSVMTVSFELFGQEFIALNADRFLNSRLPLHFLFIAKHRKRWTN